MPYRFRDEIATADVAFEAWGETLEEVIIAAADATLNVMVADLDAVVDRVRRSIHAEADAADMLLFEVLQELIYYKDAERLLLRVPKVELECGAGRFSLKAEAYGEEIDPTRHELVVDVKAVTLHRFEVVETENGWQAQVILDI